MHFVILLQELHSSDLSSRQYRGNVIDASIHLLSSQTTPQSCEVVDVPHIYYLIVSRRLESVLSTQSFEVWKHMLDLSTHRNRNMKIRDV